MDNPILEAHVKGDINDVEVTINPAIQYDNIPKERFKLFVQILRIYANDEYKEEQGDNFLDLYTYWNARGFRRFSEKLYHNISKYNLN